MLGRTFSAGELVQCGFLSRVIPADGFREAVLAQAETAASFSVEAMKATKDLVRSVDKELLLKVNEKEMILLEERMKSADSIESIRRFQGKRNYVTGWTTDIYCLEAAKKRKTSKL